MRKEALFALAAVAVLFAGFPGCTERSTGGGYCPVEGYDVVIKELELLIKCNLTDDSIGSDAYLLVPTLVNASNVPVGMFRAVSPFHVNHTITTEMTPHGWCLNITPLPCYLELDFYCNVTNATYNTQQQAIISDRFYEGTPGISVWSEDGYGTVTTMVYCNKDVESLGYQYYRAETIGADSVMIDSFSTRPDGWNGHGWRTFSLGREIINDEPPLNDK